MFYLFLLRFRSAPAPAQGNPHLPLGPSNPYTSAPVARIPYGQPVYQQPAQLTQQQLYPAQAHYFPHQDPYSHRKPFQQPRHTPAPSQHQCVGHNSGQNSKNIGEVFSTVSTTAIAVELQPQKQKKKQQQQLQQKPQKQKQNQQPKEHTSYQWTTPAQELDLAVRTNARTERHLPLTNEHPKRSLS